MALSIKGILAPLDPYWDRIIRRPMSDKECGFLERQVGLPAPAPFRDFLMQVGLFQDLIEDVAPHIRMHESSAEFASARKFVSSLPKCGDLLPFGTDDAENDCCLPPADARSCRIHVVDHETAKVSKGKDFADWLQSIVAKVLRGVRRRLPNERKVWAVQFCFSGTSYEDLKRLLASAAKFKEVDSRWTDVTDPDADVTTKERRIELDGERFKVVRDECPEWKAPMLSFDMTEPVGKGLEHARIWKLKSLFREKCPDFKLVDYGPLDSSELKGELDS